jgi:hypothetical protein
MSIRSGLIVNDMKPVLLSGALAACLCGLTSTSVGQTILLNDNFDTYLNQEAFLASWPAVGTVASGTLVSTQSVSGANAINYAITAQRNEKTFTETGIPTGNAIRFSFDFYDSDAAASPYRQYANLQDGAGPTGSGQLISLGLNNNLTSAADGGNFYMARILGYNASGYFKLNDNPELVRTTGWHNLAVEITDTEFRFFVDGFLAETVANTFTLRSYELVRLGSGLSSTREAFIDNVRIEIIPEPSSLALALLGGLGLFIFKLRRR